MESTILNKETVTQKTVESQAVSQASTSIKEQGVLKELSTQRNSFPQEDEKHPLSINGNRRFIGEMDNYDRAIEVKADIAFRRNPVWNKEVLGIKDSAGNLVYAWIIEEEDKKRRIEFCQKFANGDFSPVFTMSQGEMCMAVLEESSKNVAMKKKSEKFFSKIYHSYLDKMAGNINETLCINEVIKTLAVQLVHIPVYADDLLEMKSMEFYQRVVSIIRYYISQSFNDHKAYYPLTEDDILSLSHDLGMDKITFLRKMKKYELLYLTPSSRGYQNNVRINAGQDSYTEWRYCVKKIEEWESSSVDEKYNF